MRSSLPPLLLALLAAGAATPGTGLGQDAQDRRRPVVSLSAPDYASDRSRTRTVLVRWRGRDRGSGIARYSLEARPRTNAATRWRVVAGGAGRTSAAFHGRAGRTYELRLRARDRAGNLSRFDYDQTVVPLDDRSGRLELSKGWHRRRHPPAYRATILRARRPGRTLALGFRGSEVAVIASRKPRSGRLSIELDGLERVVTLRGRHRHRQVVFRSRLLRPGRHRVRIETLDRRVVDLDAVAVDAGLRPPRATPNAASSAPRASG